MDWITGIQKAIDYVEDHLTDEIVYEEIAKRAYSSSFHFQRIFHVICGFTLGDYIRIRRLSLAGRELAESNAKVIDIALKYGYDTPESFSRAFTRFHGSSPIQVKNGAAVKSFSRLSVKLALSGGTIMDYRMETKEAFDLIVKKKRFPKNTELTTVEITGFWAECSKDGTIDKIIRYADDKIFGKNIVGVSFEYEGDDSEFPYGIGASYGGNKITDHDLSVVSIPAHTYVVFQCVGKMPEAFQKTCQYICTEFFPTSEYQPIGLEFEAYPSPDVQNPDYTCEIWVAVEKKK
ncbi:effector binding domain-containing protein [Hominifimenecus sp. rT4P-3]|uniref:effector binding domain-containing protein n=1 Tax=Hominifimenecus sp. rT4P-3 TaxID=3242979 RepID=UPI003DA2AE16